MAAAIAASLPAPQTAPTQAAPSYEAIPASMSKVIDIEADIQLTCVQLDGMVSPISLAGSLHSLFSSPFTSTPVVVYVLVVQNSMLTTCCIPLFLRIS